MKKKASTPTNRLGKVPIKWDASRKRWRLTVHTSEGRRRTFHGTKDEADSAWAAHCDRAKRFGTAAAAYNPRAHQEWAEAKRIVGEADLREVARFYRKHHPDGAESVNVSEAIDRYLDLQRQKRLSVRYLAGVKQRLKVFNLEFGRKKIRSIRSAEILAWVGALGVDPRTIKNYAGTLAAFFSWCHRQGLLAEPPVIHGIDLPQPRPKPKGVLSVDQCAALMAHVEATLPKYVPWHALQLFAGIRRAEVGRMRWEWIDLKAKTITLPGWTEGGERVVKTGDDWALHDLPANLWAWLEKYRGEGRVKVPGNITVEKLRGEGLPNLDPVSIPSWPQNAMRHTFCTMLMSLHGDAAKVANWSRHTNAAQLYRSYVAKLVSRAEAERFCGILPNQAKGER